MGRAGARLLAANVPAAASSSRSTTTTAATCRLRALGRQRWPRRCVRELQPVAGAARARRQRRDPADVYAGPRGYAQAVHRGQDHRRADRPPGHVTRNSSCSPTGCTTARGCSCSIAWGCRSRSDATYRDARAASPGSTWARIPTRPTTTRRARSFAACRTAAAGRCCARPRRSTGSAIRSTSTGSSPLHGESTYEQFLAHYQEYTDVAGDHFLNLVATTLPTNAYLADRRAEVQALGRRLHGRVAGRGCARTAASSPATSDLDGTIGGADGRWWADAYGWGFSPVNPVTGRREDRNRIRGRSLGFGNALLRDRRSEVRRCVARR